MTMASLKDKVILITGASSGIGEATAIHLSQYQPKLSLAGRKKQNLEAVGKKCLSPGLLQDHILLVPGDLEIDDDIETLVNKTVEKFGRIDVLVNNAGFTEYKGTMSTSMDLFDRIMRVNLRAPFRLAQLCVPHLIKSQGCVLNVSSISGQRAFTGATAYCLSKAALDHFTRVLAMELAQYKIRVNSVNPGVVETNLQLRGGMTAEQYQQYCASQGEKQPLGGLGKPEEVAKAIKFFISDESSFITGEMLFVDGGRHTKPV